MTTSIPSQRNDSQQAQRSSSPRGPRPGSADNRTTEQKLQDLMAGLAVTNQNLGTVAKTAVRQDEAQQRFDQQLAATQQRLEQTGHQAKARNDRTMRLFRDLGSRVATDHDKLNEIEQQLIAVQQRVDNGMSFDLAAVLEGWTPEEVQEFLSISAEKGLTTTNVLRGMLTRIETDRKNINLLLDISAETRGIVNQHIVRLDKHDERLDAIDGPEGSIARLQTGLDRVVTTVIDAAEQQDRKWHKTLTEDLEFHSVLTKKGAISAALAFGAVWMSFWLIASHVAGKVYDKSNHLIGHATYPWFWIGLFFGVIAGGIAFVVTSRYQARLKQGRHETNETATASNNSTTRSSTTTTRQQAPADSTPTRQLPTVPADEPQPAARS